MATQTITTPIEKPKPQLKLDDVITFLSRYLYCTVYQRTLLALWILHTHCFSAAEVTPYLSIQSAIEQSGKTRSLQLLSLLCPNPALTASFATNNLSSRIHYSEQRPTFLLDECHATIGSRNRSKNPVLRAILTSGFHRGLGHTDRKGERVIFSPKAFAGIGPLPHALAERSLPIHLDRLTPSVQLHEFRSEQAEAEAQPLRQWLAGWGKENLQKLKSAPTLELNEYPAGIELTPRCKDLLKPLLQIAKVLGREWPKRVTTALTEVFKDHLNRERKHVLALLFQLREAFSHYGQPERIATASLLVWLHQDPEAPWNQEGPITSTRLAAMLRPFGILPGLRPKKDQPTHRGYMLQSFLYTWNMLLPPESTINRDTSRREPMPAPPHFSKTSEVAVRAALEAAASNPSGAQPSESQTGAGAPSYPALVGRDGGSQKPNIHAAANNLTTTREVSPNQSKSAGAPMHTSVARGGVEVPSTTKTSSQEPIAKSQKPNIHAAANNLTTTREVSAGESKSAGAPSYPGLVGRDHPDVPGVVPNPQPIPFPSKAELEKQGYRFGPFTAKHTPLDVEMIAHYAKRGYRPLQPHEVDYAEFRCNGVPFALAASVPHRPQPPEPPKPQKSREELEREELAALLRKK